MPRRARVAPKEHLYHVLTRGNNRQDVFKDEDDFRKYLDLQKRYREFVGGMLREKEAMKGEMDRRIVYGGEKFVRDMLASYHISEKIKRMGRQRGWRKNKENRPL